MHLCNKMNKASHEEITIVPPCMGMVFSVRVMLTVH